MEIKHTPVTVILQGYSVTKESLNLIVDSYLRFGYRDIIVSSYSWCVDEEYLKDKAEIIYNDDFFYENEPIFEELTKDIQDEKKRKNTKKRLNVNYQIHTTLVGINRSIEKYPENEFVIKQRCDMMLLNLESCVNKNISKIKQLKPFSGKLFKHPFFTSIINRPPYDKEWFYSDWFYLTTVDNLKKIFNIPYTLHANFKPEEYIISTYCRSINRKMPWSEFTDNYLVSWEEYPILYWYKTQGILSDNATYYPSKHKHIIPLT